ITSTLRGGKFGHGFVSAYTGAVTGGFVQGLDNAAAELIASSVLAGSISEATGGKFANGAAYAAFSWAVAQGAENLRPKSSSSRPDAGPERFSEHKKAAIRKEIELAVDADTVNKKGFESSGDGAVYLRSKLQGIAEKYDIEIGAYLPQVEGRYIIEDVQTSFHNKVVGTMVARKRTDWFHTHQRSNSEDFFPVGISCLHAAAGALDICRTLMACIDSGVTTMA
ncbi:hypothetical protein, partial [Marinimicrobium sp. ARAG 43.8]|uniref:hypothetical protein n=1 Tax=Marinimicrobium sp. ARAG 43.8 TaxID=3418719 RepID=UPI003CE68E72